MSTAISNARDTILAKLRSSIANTDFLFRNQHHRTESSSIPSAVTSADGSGPDLARIFGENLQAVLGTYEFAENPSEVPKRIVAQIERWRCDTDRAGESAGEILSWVPEELPLPDVEASLHNLGISLLVPTNMHVQNEREHAGTLSVGLTGVDAAFAGTGSMVLLPGLGKSRVASLLPLHHIALVPVSKIYPTLESWLASLRSNGTLEALFSDHAQLAFITGPSKSADIELNLTLGVHGPRDVHAIIFDDAR